MRDASSVDQTLLAYLLAIPESSMYIANVLYLLIFLGGVLLARINIKLLTGLFVLFLEVIVKNHRQLFELCLNILVYKK